MKIQCFNVIALSLLLSSACFAQVTMQSGDNVLDDGTAFLWIEGENVSALARKDAAGEVLEIGNANSRFIVVNKDNPFQTITEAADGSEVIGGGLDVLPADTNASGGGALFDNWTPEGPNDGPNRATWQMQFEIPATYYMYFHYSMYNRDGNNNYLNEDSMYVSPGFNLDARSDWIGFEGQNFSSGDPETGNSDRDGWIPLSKNVVDLGGIDTHNDAGDDFWNGNFHWGYVGEAVNMDENNQWVSDSGMALKYEVTEDMVGTVVDFEISAREVYGAIDGILFATSDLLLDDYSQQSMDEFFLNLGGETVEGDFDASGALDLADINMLSAEIAAGSNLANFDLTSDGIVDGTDLNRWVKTLRKTWFGDANLDGEFNSGDLVEVFQGGKFETDDEATWIQGDWNGDQRFNSGDLVSAFQDGGFELGPVATNAVPEPSSILIALIGGGFLLTATRRRASRN